MYVYRFKYGLETGAEHQSRFLVQEFGQSGFQLFVEIESPVQETGAGATGAIFADGFDGRLPNFGVSGQSQVVIGADHN